MSSPAAPGPAITTPDAPPAPLCPDCGSALTADPRFVRWCQSCTWNAHPQASTAATRGDRFDRRLNRAAEAQLFRRVTEANASGLWRVRDASWLTAAALASLVHLVTLVIGLSGVALIALQPGNRILQFLGAVLVLAAVGLRPRLGTMRRARRRSTCVERQQAPALYALTDRIAAELGTAQVRLIRVDARYNASYTRVGLRRQPVLTLGLPLWETLSPQQRVALLAHELGHGANGDTSHGLWIGSALGCLAQWYGLLVPGRHTLGAGRDRGAGGTSLFVVIGEMLARIVLFVFAEATLLLYRLLRRATVFGTRRGEYLADSLATRIAGNAATAELLQQLTLGHSVTQVRQQRRFGGAPVRSRRGQAAAATPPRADFWTELRAYVDSIPESERARRLVVSELDDSATDATHPPTHLRLAFVQLQPRSEPLVVPTPAELAAVEAELAPARAQTAARLERTNR